MLQCSIFFSAVLINMVTILIAYVTVTVVGVVSFVYFNECDPLYNGDITKGDQVSIKEHNNIHYLGLTKFI